MNGGGGLFQRAIRGGLWVFALSVSQEILALARLVILARLLSPNDFGLAGIAMLALATVDSVTQTGFDAALIQRKQDSRPYLDSAWTVGILRGLAVFALMVLVAPYAAGFFRAPEATALVRVIAVSVLARSFANIGVVYFRKELEFGRQFVWQFGGRLADFVVAVIAAFALRSVWALVLAFVAGDLVKLLLSYTLHPYRPRLSLDRERTGELFGFGKWLVGIGILVLLLTQIDNAVVGRLVGATALGFYQLARRVANVPATEIAHVIANVTFPAYSKLQDRIAKLREAYLMVLETTALAALPLAGGLLLLAPEITLGFFGEKWLPAVGAIRILAVWGVLGALASTTDAVFMAMGKPRTVSKYQSIQLVVLVSLIYPLTLRWGIRGTSLAVMLASAVPSYLALRRAGKETQGPAFDFARAIGLPLVGVCAAALPVLLFKHLRFAQPPWGLAGALVAFGAVYVVVVRFLGERFGYRVGPLAREVLKALRRGSAADESAPD